jgi:copper(I)-binding protein
VTRMPRRLLAGAIVVLIPALAGCEAGLNAPTANFHPAANGAYQTTGPVLVNNAFVLGAPLGQTLPAGGDASVFLALYSPNGDTLTSISATDGAAQSVTVTGGSVNLPASTSVNLTGPTPEVVLTDLKQPLAAGGTVWLTLNFASASPINLDVPVVPQANAYATFAQPSPVAPTPTASAAATIAASASASTKASASRKASTKATHGKHAHPSATASPTPSVTP